MGTLLPAAAGKEFKAAGFVGTDITRIARIAGYALQTFDRHFAEKTEILIRVHERSQEDERAKLRAPCWLRRAAPVRPSLSPQRWSPAIGKGRPFDGRSG